MHLRNQINLSATTDVRVYPPRYPTQFMLLMAHLQVSIMGVVLGKEDKRSKEELEQAKIEGVLEWCKIADRSVGNVMYV